MKNKIKKFLVLFMFVSSISLASADPKDPWDMDPEEFWNSDCGYYQELLEKWRDADWTLQRDSDGAPDFARDDGRFAREVKGRIAAGGVSNLLIAADTCLSFLNRLAKLFEGVKVYNKMGTGGLWTGNRMLNTWINTGSCCHPGYFFPGYDAYFTRTFESNKDYMIKIVFNVEDPKEARSIVKENVYIPFKNSFKKVIEEVDEKINKACDNKAVSMKTEDCIVNVLKKIGFSKNDMLRFAKMVNVFEYPSKMSCVFCGYDDDDDYYYDFSFKYWWHGYFTRRRCPLEKSPEWDK